MFGLELKDERESIRWETIWVDGICRKSKARNSKDGGNLQGVECYEFICVRADGINFAREIYLATYLSSN